MEVCMELYTISLNLRKRRVHHGERVCQWREYSARCGPHKPRVRHCDAHHGCNEDQIESLEERVHAGSARQLDIERGHGEQRRHG